MGKSYIHGVFSDKVLPEIDFTDHPTVQCECNFSVLKNTLADDSDIEMTFFSVIYNRKTYTLDADNQQNLGKYLPGVLKEQINSLSGHSTLD